MDTAGKISRGPMGAVSVADAEREAGERYAAKASGGSLRKMTEEELKEWNSKNSAANGIEAINVFTDKPLAMTGAEAEADAEKATGLEEAMLSPKEVSIRFLNCSVRGMKPTAVWCHHFCFFDNEAHFFEVKGGELVKRRIFKNVESVEVIG